ncbi:MAG: twin transmembrane helix small protein [Gammaproteobacteria bacterium]
MIKLLVLVLLAAIVVSLFSGLFFLNRDQGGSGRMVRALTVRIVLSVLLFVILLIAWRTGAIQPHAVMPAK